MFNIFSLKTNNVSALSYPGGRPLFNPSHFASNGCVASIGILPTSTTTYNILRLGFVQQNGGRTAVIDPVLGTAVNLNGFSNCRIENLPTTGTSNKCTFAVMVRIPAVGANNGTLMNDTNTNSFSVALSITSSKTVSFSKNGSGTIVDSGITLSNNVPYFIIASSDDTIGVNFLVLRLDTGQVTTVFVADTNTITTTTGGFITYAGGALSYNIIFGLGMFATSAGGAGAIQLSIAQMLQWAQNPWQFWFPNGIDLIESIYSFAQLAQPDVQGYCFTEW
jgi:hypothetical protein